MKNSNFLNDYEVMKTIGKGGFGTVMKVISKKTGVTRAAKKIKKSALPKEERKKLLAEMGIMMGLDHPSIARLF